MGEAPSIDVVFFDIRDTLGVVDRPGHLLKFRPTTDQLLDAVRGHLGLRIGILTNLPKDVSSEAGRAMLVEAGIWSHVDPEAYVTNHDAGADKPDPAIFRFAAKKLELDPARCLFVGENLLEVLGAQAAGMRATLKPFPPARDFLRGPLPLGATTPVDSGRVMERILEEEHLVGKRIVVASVALRDRLDRALADGGELPTRAMGLVTWLTLNFVDPYHHRKEEEVVNAFALMRGLPLDACAFVAEEHEQGRAYFRGMDVAYRRVLRGERQAAADFRACLSGFIELYKLHGKKEDDVLLKAIGDRLTSADDALVVDLMSRIGPADPTLYYAAIADLEQALA